jgi:VIT1/CCC1 family predicted Fe2+/Mn2+ transporter
MEGAPVAMAGGALARVRASLHASIGDVAFGMEDGAVSIAGLVFGVAASTNDSSIVLLAGATGAIAGAVSMMAGTYLDVESQRDRAAAMVQGARDRIAIDPAPYLDVVRGQLRAAGLEDREVDPVLDAFVRSPDVLLDHVAAFQLGVTPGAEASPKTHALWMFAADLFAASVPVLPFAFLPIGPASVVSLVVTGALMGALGLARARIGHTPLLWTALQTMAIAGAAALAGVIIGRLVSG